MNRNEKIDEIIEMLLSLRDKEYSHGTIRIVSKEHNNDMYGEIGVGEIKILPHDLEFKNYSDLERRFKELLPDEK